MRTMVWSLLRKDLECYDTMRLRLSGTGKLFEVTEERIIRFSQKRKINRNVNRTT